MSKKFSHSGIITRRQFSKGLLYSSAAFALGACSKESVHIGETAVTSKPELKLSLAQWALQTAQFGNTFNENYEQWQTWLKTDPAKVLQGELSPMMFPEYVKDTFGINAVDFVNTFYFAEVKNDKYWAELRQRCADNDIVANNIMLDQEGYLGHNDKQTRLSAIENHKKWIDVAAKLTCESVRINVHGIGDWQTQLNNAVDSASTLADYAQNQGVTLLIENHGGLSSNADWLLELLQTANHNNLQILLDYDNFKWSETDIWQNTQRFNRYDGVAKLMPFTNCVSVKTYAFDEQGNETTIDVARMVDIAQENNFAGYHSVEFEGSHSSPIEGINKTINLLKRVW